MNRTIVIVGMLLVLAGCSSKPSFVGDWRAVNMPSNVPPDATGMTASMNEDQSFTLILRDSDQAPVYTMSGVWQRVSEREAQLEIEHGSRRPGGEEASARLDDDGQMVVNRLNDQITFERTSGSGN